MRDCSLFAPQLVNCLSVSFPIEAHNCTQQQQQRGAFAKRYAQSVCTVHNAVNIGPVHTKKVLFWNFFFEV